MFNYWCMAWTFNDTKYQRYVTKIKERRAHFIFEDKEWKINENQIILYMKSYLTIAYRRALVYFTVNESVRTEKIMTPNKQQQKEQ